MKQLKHHALSMLIALLCSLTSHAHDFESGGIYFNIKDGSTVAVAQSPSDAKYSGDVTIPSSVTHQGNVYTVTAIGETAMRDCSGLTSIVIPSSVTEIGNSAFYNCTSLTSVTIPSGVTKIGKYAFIGCKALESIALPSTLVTIENHAFYFCDKLSSLTIPAGVENIGGGIIAWCKALKKVDVDSKSQNFCSVDGVLYSYDKTTLVAFPYAYAKTSYDILSSVTTIGPGAFEACALLKAVNIPKSVRTIGESAFQSCSYITSITIPNGVTTLEQNVFYNMLNLSSITIPTSVTKIGWGAISDNRKLQAVNIPASVTEINSTAFRGNTALTSINVDANNPNYKTIGGILYNKDATTIVAYPCGLTATSFVIPSSVTQVEGFCFAACTNLTSVTIPAGVTKIGLSAFSGCKNLKEINSLIIEPPYCGSAFEWSHYNTVQVNIPAGTLDNYKEVYEWNMFTNLVAPETDVADGDKFEDGGLTFEVISVARRTARLTRKNSGSYSGNINIPGTASFQGLTFSVVEIGEKSFHNNNYVTAVTIPGTVTTIGEWAFYNCQKITALEIPNSVTTIQEGAFSCCKGLTTFVIPGSVTELGSSAFATCSGLESIEISSSITSIESSTFLNCGKLAQVKLPESLEYIGTGAFTNCKSLTDIEIPASVTGIDGNPFTACDNLAVITVAGGDNFYFKDDCLISKGGTLVTGLNKSSIVIPGSVTAIGNSAFSSSNLLESIEIPTSVTSIGENAFSACKKLTTVEIPTSVTSIGKSAFSGSYLTQMVIPSSITRLDEYTFYDCYQMTSIDLPASLTELGNNALQSCGGLKQIISRNPTPPTSPSFPFGKVSTSECIIYVPAGAVDAYKAADYWKEFLNITALEDEPGDDSEMREQLLAEIEDMRHTVERLRAYMAELKEGTGNRIEYLNEWIEETDAWADITAKILYDLALSVQDSEEPVDKIAAQVETRGNDVASLAKTVSNMMDDFSPLIPVYGFLCKIQLMCEQYKLTANEDVSKALAAIWLAYDSCTSAQDFLTKGQEMMPQLMALINKYVTDAWVVDVTSSQALEEMFLPYAQAKAQCDRIIVVGMTNAGITFGTFLKNHSNFKIVDMSLADVDNFTFSGSSNLQELILPTSLRQLNSGALFNCTSLKSVMIDSSNRYYSTQDGILFDYKKTKLIFYPYNDATSYTVPEGVIEIGEDVFLNNNTLTSVNLPSTLKKIGYCALCSMEGIMTLTLPASLEEGEKGACSDLPNLKELYSLNPVPPTLYWLGLNSNVTIYVPGGSKKAYIEAQEWKNYASQIHEMGELARGDVFTVDGIHYEKRWDWSNDVYVTYGRYDEVMPLAIPDLTPLMNQDYKGRIMIPDSVYFNGIGYRVVGIGEWAFNESQVTSVTLPKTVSEIERRAFISCDDFAELIIPGGSKLDRIGDDCFRFCPKTIDIHVKDLGTWRDIYLSRRQNGEANIDLLLGNPKYPAYGSFKWNLIVDGKKLEHLDLDEELSRWGNCIFRGCASLKTVNIMVETHIYWKTFEGCSNLATVTFDETATVDTIWDMAFASCTSIKEMNVPQGVTTINKFAFHNCQSLTHLSLPSTLKKFASSAIGECPNLQCITLYSKELCKEDESEKVLGVGEYTTDITLDFNTCELRVPHDCIEDYKKHPFWGKFLHISAIPGTVKVGDEFCYDGLYYKVLSTDDMTVEVIPDRAYNYRDIPNDVVVPKNVEYNGHTFTVVAIGSCALYKNYRIHTVSLPGTVTELKADAFYGDDGLTRINLPSHLATIGSAAFRDCENLEEIICTATVPPVCTYMNVFDNVTYYDCTLYVPRGCKGIYSETEPWSEFENIVEIDGMYEIYNGTSTPLLANDWNEAQELATAANALCFARGGEDTGASNVIVNGRAQAIAVTHGEPIYCPTDVEAAEVDYLRTFNNNSWQPLYVPFAIKHDEWKDKIRVAYINNVVQYDEDEDGTADYTVVIFNTRKSGDLLPNTPYLIKPLTTGDMKIKCSNTVLKATGEKDGYIDCSSTASYFRIAGSYQAKELPGDGNYALDGGRFVPMGDDDSVAPFGVYLTVTGRTRSASSAPRDIRISIDGEEIEDRNFVLNKGWNWISSNISGITGALAFIAPIKDKVTRFMSQTQELVNDEKFGFVGNLNDIEPTQGYKLHVDGATSMTWQETVFNPVMVSQELERGWNWMGYLPCDTMSVGEALGNLQASKDDIIKAQDKFATFNGSAWTGNLTDLNPGEGYMYYSASHTSFHYPAHGTHNMITMHRVKEATALPWTCDSHRYPDNATMIARLEAEGDYTVGAFIDGECRGIGTVIDGRIFLTIHGETGDGCVTLRAIDNATHEELEISETILFSDNMVGTYSSPFLLHLEDGTTGVATTLGAHEKSIFSVSGMKVKSTLRRGVYIRGGKKIVVK